MPLYIEFPVQGDETFRGGIGPYDLARRCPALYTPPVAVTHSAWADVAWRGPRGEGGRDLSQESGTVLAIVGAELP
jgi:hypothetical protein